MNTVLKYMLTVFFFLAAGALVGCGQEEKQEEAGAEAAGHSGSFSGEVVETMNAAGYTYVLVNTGPEKLWAAARVLSVKPGDTVQVSGGTPMENFASKTLGRTFERIYFSNRIVKKGGAAASSPKSAAPHQSKKAVPAAKKAQAMDFSGIVKPPQGYTVYELHEQQESLEGKQVSLRAKVAKANYRIMGRNWFHLQDGSGMEGTNDITVTSPDSANLNATVLVTGTLVRNKNLGSGYFFKVMIEEARFSVE